MTTDPTIELAWRAADGGAERTVRVASGRAVPEDAVRELGLKVVRNTAGSTWRVVVCPQRDVRLVRATATLHYDFADWSSIYLNGYNSWTDSVERALDDRMAGLSRMPRAAIDHWVLDGSGDYRFTKQDTRRGHQHGFGYGYLRDGDTVSLFGSLEEDSGFTTIWEDLRAGTITLDKEVPAADLTAEREREVLSFAVLGGALDDAVEAWLSLSGIACRPAPRVVGYSSWYRHYTDIDEAKLTHDFAGLEEALGGVDTAPAVKVFQVDDGYTKVGDWQTLDVDKFPRELGPVAAAARDHGYVPGLWMAPFVCERESRLFADHPGWLLRDEAGEVVLTGSHWSGQVALDTLNSEVRAYVTASIRKAVDEWGFGFLKLDFLYGACMLPHGGKNRGELMADALDLLREAAGDGVWLDFCGVPMVSAFGRCEFCRVGCDVGLDWDDKAFMRLTGRERVSTKNNLANTRGRAHLDGRAFGCDPDVFFLRRDVKLTDAQRADLLDADTRLGSVFFTSDDLGAWDAGQLATYHAALTKFCERG